MRVVLASRNAHKAREFAEILGVEDVLPLPDEVELPPETADTFAGNALIKARAAHSATGMAVIADDSGLVVDGLDGAPGVRSARFAGENASDEDNLRLLISNIESLERPERSARYVCALAWIDEDGIEQVFEGVCEGQVEPDRRGSGGFGYDPVFVPLDTGEADARTMAELSPEEKNAISHRGRAARMMAARISSA